MRKPVVDQVFGDNKAPIDVVLVADFADLKDEADAMAERAKDLPKKVKSDADLSFVGSAIADARDLAKRVEGTRMEEGRPLLDATKAINGHFKALVAIVTEAVKPAQDAADAYVREKKAAEEARRKREVEEARRKEEAARAKAESAATPAAAAKAAQEAERYAHAAETAGRGTSAPVKGGGVTASSRGHWTYRLIDYDTVEATLGKLGPFVPREAVLSAIGGYVNSKKAHASIPGIEVFLDTKASFRK